MTPDATVQARYNPQQRRDRDGQWTDDGVPNRRRSGGPARSGDRLGVGDRAGFEHGEQVIESDRIRSTTGFNDVDWAVVRGERGDTELRLHTGGGDEPWDGGGDETAQLEPEQVRELRDTLQSALEQAEVRAREAGDDFDDDRIAEGQVGDEWGSVQWSTWLNDQPGGWEMSLNTASGGPGERGDGATLTPAQVRRLIRILNGLEATMGGNVAAARRNPAPLATIRNVELARVGSWSLSSGQWDPKPQDFAAAVAALNCPAVRPARIRLGHVDPRFDGEPAVGTVTKLRVEAGGHSLVGDLDKVPGWLPNIVAAAYPDRSVEGTYDFTCQIGHRHPFVLTGLALLGVTAPGVGTLRSIDDVGTLYGQTPVPVAAGRPVSATFTAAAGGDDNQLKRYWVHGEGAKRWVHDRHPWSKLVKLLTEHVGPERAKRIASSFFHARFGYWPGHRKGTDKTGPG